MTFRIKEITGTAYVPATFRLRFEVWNAETLLLPHIIEIGLITDEHDAHARHWAVFRENELVAAARMCTHHHAVNSPDGPAFSETSLPPPVATLNRLIVLPGARRHGLAAMLDESRIAAARASGAKCVVGTFPPYRVENLEAAGFSLIGKEWIPNYAKYFVSQAMVLML